MNLWCQLYDDPIGQRDQMVSAFTVLMSIVENPLFNNTGSDNTNLMGRQASTWEKNILFWEIFILED